MILGAFIQQIYTVTDSLVVGNVVGSDALAAIGATGTCIFFLLSLNSGLANACSVVLAQAYGAGSKRDIAASLASTLYYTGLCALVLGVGGGFCVEPLLRLMQTPEDILPQAVLYLRIYICCSAGQIVYNNAAAVLQALGDSKTPLLFLIVCTVLNIALDFLFVLVLRAVLPERPLPRSFRRRSRACCASSMRCIAIPSSACAPPTFGRTCAILAGSPGSASRWDCNRRSLPLGT